MPPHMIRMPSDRCSQVVGIFLPKSPAPMPPNMLPSRQGKAIDQSIFSGRRLNTIVTRQIGSIMDTEAGKMASSFIFVSQVSKGTSTIPPPAPNRPATAPASAPHIAIGKIVFFKETPPVEIFSTGGKNIHLAEDYCD